MLSCLGLMHPHIELCCLWLTTITLTSSYCPVLLCLSAADTHLHFLLEFCSGGELYALLNAQPK